MWVNNKTRLNIMKEEEALENQKNSDDDMSEWEIEKSITQDVQQARHDESGSLSYRAPCFDLEAEFDKDLSHANDEEGDETPPSTLCAKEEDEEGRLLFVEDDAALDELQSELQDSFSVASPNFKKGGVSLKASRAARMREQCRVWAEEHEKSDTIVDEEEEAVVWDALIAAEAAKAYEEASPAPVSIEGQIDCALQEAQDEEETVHRPIQQCSVQPEDDDDDGWVDLDQEIARDAGDAAAAEKKIALDDRPSGV